MRKSSNCLHFFINGEDQGMAVSGIPENVFGVVDLYGAAVKVSLCENQSSCSAMANEIINSESQETLFAGIGKNENTNINYIICLKSLLKKICFQGLFTV